MVMSSQASTLSGDDTAKIHINDKDETNEYSRSIHDSFDVQKLEDSLEVYTDHRLNHSRLRWFWKISLFMDRFGEIRSVQRTPPERRRPLTLVYLTRLTGIWCGITLSIPTMTGLFLGSTLYGLSFRASLSSGILGVAFGALAAAYGITMGPRTGLRGMMQGRFVFGWWFSKFVSFLNCLTLLGWLIINGNFGGQFLSALTNYRISVEVGIVVLFVISLLFSTFGFRLMSFFDACLIIPLFVTVLLCYICMGDSFDVSHHSMLNGVLLKGIDSRTAWVTNFGATIGITSTYIPTASDYHLDMPNTTNRLLLFIAAFAWVFLPTAFAGIFAIGIVSRCIFDENLMDLYNEYGGAGVIVEGMRKWNGGGIFLCVILYISLITNSASTVYSFGLSLQAIAKPIARFPRYLLVLLGSIIWFVLTSVGKSGWAEVVSNFMPMIGYWSMIYFVVMVVELEFFRRRKEDEPDWSQYLNYNHFPFLGAAVLAFGFGVAGVVIGMDQYYYVGRLAGVIGSGCEIGTLMAMGLTFISYVPLRYLEIRWRKSKDNGIIRP